MINITIQNQSLLISLEGADRILSLKSQLSIPLSHITDIQVVNDLQTSDYLKWYDPKVGLFLPGTIADGTFYQKDGRLFAIIREGQRGLVLKLAHDDYHEIVIELKNPESTAEEIRRALGN